MKHSSKGKKIIDTLCNAFMYDMSSTATYTYNISSTYIDIYIYILTPASTLAGLEQLGSANNEIMEIRTPNLKKCVR